MSDTGKSGRILLLHPPYTDFTCPYHSLSYVAAPLIAAGYEVDILDMNALWFRGVFNSNIVERWRETLEHRIRACEASSSLSVENQISLAADIGALAACCWLEPERVVETLQGTQFYDFAAYDWAQRQVSSFETLLDRFYGPYCFSKAFSVAPHEPRSGALVDKADRCTGLIDDFVAILSEQVGGRDYLFCGITAPYSSNLVPAMALFNAVARVFPGTTRVAGGSAVTDVYKYRRDSETLAAFAGHCDFFYTGEAETGVIELADFLCGAAPEPPPQAVRLDAGPASETKQTYVALASGQSARGRYAPYDWLANPPLYDWIDWSLYLSPEKRINYAPIRGCFWNKCTFCDYGLNEDGPTAPYRAMNVDVALAHLRGLSSQGIRHVYLAADAVSPSFLNKLADGLIEEALDLSWSCQIFLTRAFTPDLIRKLERSGMRLASFGLESGSARVLERMGKGADRVDQVLHPVLGAFRQSRIGLQPLYFYGFPGETDSDRQATVDLLLHYADLFSPISRGGLFGLMAGSMIAKAPEKFGLRDVAPAAGDDIMWELDFRSDAPEHLDCPRAAEPFDRQLPSCDRFERPWAGGVDTFHSQLFVERFGRDVFDHMRAALPPEPTRSIRLQSRFDLSEVIETALIATAVRNGRAGHVLTPELAALTKKVLVPAHRLKRRRSFAVSLDAG